jgi:hypothetical protein
MDKPINLIEKPAEPEHEQRMERSQEIADTVRHYAMRILLKLRDSFEDLADPGGNPCP